MGALSADTKTKCNRLFLFCILIIHLSDYNKKCKNSRVFSNSDNVIWTWQSIHTYNHFDLKIYFAIKLNCNTNVLHVHSIRYCYIDMRLRYLDVF